MSRQFSRAFGTLPPVRYVLPAASQSERKVVCFLPSYEELEDPPFECLRISARNKKFSGELTHRDFLGALMNLGIERAMIGDIVVKDLDGYVMVLKKISRYVLENLDTVGRTAVEAAVWEGAEELLEPEYEEVAGTVSSVRLDAIVALCGRVSRTKPV
ncbi:MAG: YlmH/Sll1252 family protein [Clostridium sp.]